MVALLIFPHQWVYLHEWQSFQRPENNYKAGLSLSSSFLPLLHFITPFPPALPPITHLLSRHRHCTHSSLRLALSTNPTHNTTAMKPPHPTSAFHIATAQAVFLIPLQAAVGSALLDMGCVEIGEVPGTALGFSRRGVHRSCHSTGSSES